MSPKACPKPSQDELLWWAALWHEAKGPSALSLWFADVFFSPVSCCFAHFIVRQGHGLQQPSRRTCTFWKQATQGTKLYAREQRCSKDQGHQIFAQQVFCLRQYALLKRKSQSDWTGSGTSNWCCESCSNQKRSRCALGKTFACAFGGLLRTFS